jgi:hypothetical protein
MLSRFASYVVLLAMSGFVQTPSAPSLRIFHDQALDITFAYPGEFTAVVSDSAKGQSSSKNEPQCVRSILSAGAESKQGSSAFVISIIDNSCPGVLKQAEQEGSFTRDQILRQLKQYGMASLTQEPFRYSIDGRPAAVTLATAKPDDSSVSNGHVLATYAAKACFLSNLPEHGSGKQAAAASGEVICFDYTTQNRELLTRILSFTVKFGDGDMHPMVPGNALH